MAIKIYNAEGRLQAVKIQPNSVHEGRQLFGFSKEVIANLKKLIEDMDDAGKLEFNSDNQCVSITGTEEVDKLLLEMFDIEREPKLYRVNVDIMVKAHDDDEASYKVDSMFGTARIDYGEYVQYDIDSVWDA